MFFIIMKICQFVYGNRNILLTAINLLDDLYAKHMNTKVYDLPTIVTNWKVECLEEVGIKEFLLTFFTQQVVHFYNWPWQVRNNI